MSLPSAARQFAVDMAVAFQFLTRLPLPEVGFAPDGLARAVKFFPLVGLVVGAGAALLQRVLAPHLGRSASGVAVLLYLVLITGCLHEDGLADIADSLGGWSPEQRLAILRDSRIGSYGAAALALSLLGRAVLLAGLPVEHFAAYLVTAHVLCRWSTLPLSYYLPPARESEGQGARVARVTSASSLIVGSLFTLATAVVALRKAAIAPVLSAILVPLLSGFFYMRKLGGVTGDCFGATNQLTEIAVYLCGAWKTMSRVFFIRHAETEMAGRFCGQSDPDLNARGVEQLKELAQLLSVEAIDLVYSSDLRRARRTAQAIGAAKNNIPLVLRLGLREIDFGEWEGLSWEQIERIDPGYARKWMTGYPHLPAPSGESFHAFEERILQELNHLLDSNRGPIAVVTHAGVLRVALRHLCGCSSEEAWRQTRPYCCVVRYDYAGKLPGELPATQPAHVMSAREQPPKKTVWSTAWRRMTQPRSNKRRNE